MAYAKVPVSPRNGASSAKHSSETWNNHILCVVHMAQRVALKYIESQQRMQRTIKYNVVAAT